MFNEYKKRTTPRIHNDTLWPCQLGQGRRSDRIAHGAEAPSCTCTYARIPGKPSNYVEKGRYFCTFCPPVPCKLYMKHPPNQRS